MVAVNTYMLPCQPIILRSRGSSAVRAPASMIVGDTDMDDSNSVQPTLDNSVARDSQVPKTGNATTFETPPPSEKNHRDYTTSWCPFAKCNNSPLCQPCSRRYLIVIASGRSASTTMLYMMNRLPNVRLSGENNNMVRAIDTMLRTMSDREDLAEDLEGAWKHAAIRKSDFACVAQSMMNAINPPEKLVQEDEDRLLADEDTILGWKTIRFHLNSWPTEQSVAFLREHFPCSRVIINYNSNIRRQAESLLALWGQGENMKEVQEELEAENDQLLDVANKLGSNQAFVMDTSIYESPESGVREVNAMVKWLGFKGCTFTDLLHENKDHGYALDKHNVSLGLNCRYDDNP